MLSFIKTKNTIEIVVKGKSYSIHETNPDYKKVIEAVRKHVTLVNAKSVPTILKDSLVALEGLLDLAVKIKNLDPKIRIDGNTIYFGEDVLHGTVVDRIFDLISIGMDASPVIRFLEKLLGSNPNKDHANDLYKFLEYGKLPLTPDGDFLAYKVVRGDYKDKHSGKMDNSPGKIVEMDRKSVDNRRDVTCSTGLHFCSYEYISVFISRNSDDKIVIVKVNPADVVSIPSDYNNTKARCCRYEVVSDATQRIIDTDKQIKDVLKDKKVDEEFVKPAHTGWKDKGVENFDRPNKAYKCESCGHDHFTERTGYTTANGTVMGRRQCKNCKKTKSYVKELPPPVNATPKKPKKMVAAQPSTGIKCYKCGTEVLATAIDDVYSCPNCYHIQKGKSVTKHPKKAVAMKTKKRRKS